MIAGTTLREVVFRLGQNRQGGSRLKPKRSLIRSNSINSGGFTPNLIFRHLEVPRPGVEIAVHSHTKITCMDSFLYNNGCQQNCSLRIAKLLQNEFVVFAWLLSCLCFRGLPSDKIFSGDWLFQISVTDGGGGSNGLAFDCQLMWPGMSRTQQLLSMVTWDDRGRFTGLFVAVARYTATLYCVGTSLCRSCDAQTITRTATSFFARPTHGKFLELELTKQIVRMVGLSLGQIWICLQLTIKCETEDRIVPDFHFAQFAQLTFKLVSN